MGYGFKPLCCVLFISTCKQVLLTSFVCQNAQNLFKTGFFTWFMSPHCLIYWDWNILFLELGYNITTPWSSWREILRPWQRALRSMSLKPRCACSTVLTNKLSHSNPISITNISKDKMIVLGVIFDFKFQCGQHLPFTFKRTSKALHPKRPIRLYFTLSKAVWTFL